MLDVGLAMAVDVRLFSGEVAREDVRLRAPATETSLAGVAAPLLVLSAVVAVSGLLPSPATPSLALQATSFVTSPTVRANDVKIGVPPVAPGITVVSSALMAPQPSVVVTPTSTVSVAARMPLVPLAFVSDRPSDRNDVWLRVPPDPNAADVRLYNVPVILSGSLTLTSSGFLTPEVLVDFLADLSLSSSSESYASDTTATFPVDLSLVSSAAVASTGGLAFVADLSLLSSTGFSSSVNADLVGFLTLPATSAVQLSASHDAVASLALLSASGFLPASVLDAVASTTLASGSGLTSTAIVDMVASGFYSVVASMSSSAGLVLEASQSMDASAQFGDTSNAAFLSNQTLSNVTADLVLDVTTEQLVQAVFVAVSGLSSFALADLVASRTLGATTALTFSTANVMEASMAFTSSPTFLSNGTKAFFDSLGFASSAGFFIGVELHPFVPKPPPDHVLRGSVPPTVQKRPPPTSVSVTRVSSVTFTPQKPTPPKVPSGRSKKKKP